MAKLEMTLYEAISKLKVYEERLKNYDTKGNKMFFGKYTEADPKVGGMDIETAERLIQGNHDSFAHLISNVGNLRAVIYEANIKNKISIPEINNGEEITLAYAVSRYNTMKVELSYWDTIERQQKEILSSIERENERKLKQDTIYSEVSKAMSDSKKKDGEAESFEKLVQAYIERNTVKLLDPLKFVSRDYVRKEKERIVSLRDTFHTKLMSADVNIKVEVELED